RRRRPTAAWWRLPTACSAATAAWWRRSMRSDAARSPMRPTRSGSNWNSASRRSPPVNNREETGHPAQPGACDHPVSSRQQTGKARIPAPVEAARLAGKNRAKQAENRQLMQPGLAALVRALAVFAVIAALLAHDSKHGESISHIHFVVK